MKGVYEFFRPLLFVLLLMGALYCWHGDFGLAAEPGVSVPGFGATEAARCGLCCTTGSQCSKSGGSYFGDE